MTTDQKPWRAQVPPSYSVSGNVQWNRVFDERAVRSLVFKCNEELDAAMARIAELEDTIRVAHAPIIILRDSEETTARIAELEARLAERDAMLLHVASVIDGDDKGIQPEDPRWTPCLESGRRLRGRIAELEAAESANLRAIGEASGAMYEPDMGPTWPGSWEEQVSVIRGLRESQRYETERFLRIEKLLVDQCECSCDCSAGEHGEDCDPCFPCRVNAALRGVSL